MRKRIAANKILLMDLILVGWSLSLSPVRLFTEARKKSGFATP